MRQVVLDTETTGLDPQKGHRIIEIGCVELSNRRLTGNHYHQYIQPQREIETQAIEVHGITNEFLQDKPIFIDVMDEFMQFVKGAELIIHNAPFDIGFIDHELAHHGNSRFKAITEYCSVIDTLVMARQKHPGQKNSLDALCKRYGVDNSQRDLHGALLDSEILADVYLLMTGGQTSLLLGAEDTQNKPIGHQKATQVKHVHSSVNVPIIKATTEELTAHRQKLESIEKISQGNCIWLSSDID